jgi:hypothetical protein
MKNFVIEIRWSNFGKSSFNLEYVSEIRGAPKKMEKRYFFSFLAFIETNVENVEKNERSYRRTEHRIPVVANWIISRRYFNAKQNSSNGCTFITRNEEKKKTQNQQRKCENEITKMKSDITKVRGHPRCNASSQHLLKNSLVLQERKKIRTLSSSKERKHFLLLEYV